MPRAKATTKTTAKTTTTKTTTTKPATTKPAAKTPIDSLGLPLGEYKALVEGDDNKAIAKLFKGEDEIYSSNFEPTEIKVDSLGKTLTLGAFKTAHTEVIKVYNSLVPPKDGLIDLNALVVHPANKLIYGEDDPVDDLVELLEKDDGQIFQLEVDLEGKILSGNRRRQAAAIVNQHCIEAGKPPKYELVPVKVSSLPDLESQVKYMVLHNKTRVKTPEQIANEIDVLVKLSGASAKPELRLSNAEAIEQIREKLGGGGNKKAARSTAFDAKKVVKEVEGYNNKELAEEIKKYNAVTPTKAAELVSLKPLEGCLDKEEYQAKVLKTLKAQPTLTVDKAASEVKRGVLSEAVDPKQDKTAELVKTCLECGDKPNDNRKTPKPIVGLAVDCLGIIDLDAFAMLTDPEHVPAGARYTILDDGFKASNPFGGRVFSNPPFSRAKEALEKHSDEICAGNTEKLLLILPSSVLSTKSYHSFLRDHDPLVLIPDKRLAFEPGAVLLAENHTATANGNREPSVILLWSQDAGDYSLFHDAAMGLGWVGRSYSIFNPYALVSLFDSIQWEEADKKLSAVIFGTEAEIKENGKTFDLILGGSKDSVVTSNLPSQKVAKHTAIVQAIAALDPLVNL